MIVTGIVRLTKDPEMRETKGGATLCSSRGAYNTGFGDYKAAHFIDLTVWGKMGESFGKHMGKGDPVFITGELSSREHEDKTYWGISVSSWSFVPKTKDKPVQAGSGGRDGEMWDNPADPDDLPF